MRIRNHRLRSMMLMLFIGILLFNYVNATMFWHSHVVDGRVITHSHIFWKNHLTGSQDGGHTQGRRAWSSYKAALLAREKCSDQMLADARTILESRKAAYSQGDSSLLDYLLAVRVYNDTAEACIGAKSAVITAAARLLAAVGCESL